MQTSTNVMSTSIMLKPRIFFIEVLTTGCKNSGGATVLALGVEFHKTAGLNAQLVAGRGGAVRASTRSAELLAVPFERKVRLVTDADTVTPVGGVNERKTVALESVQLLRTPRRRY